LIGSLARCALAFLALAQAVHPAWADSPEPVLLTWEELEAQGAKIGKIHVDTLDVFDLTDPREDKSFYRAVNFLHLTTRPVVIARTLLFKSGEPVSARLIEETQRVLLGYKYIYAVDIRPRAYHEGVVDIDVITRDTWTLDVVFSLSHTGGANSSRIGLTEYNLLGTATTLGIFQTSTPDRHGTQFQLTYPQAFDNWTTVSYTESRNSDGENQAAVISRPFYALDTRWAAGGNWLRNNRIDSVYNAGESVSQFRHLTEGGQVSGGWSPGLIDGWANRFSGGISVQDDTYSMVPGQVSTSPFPVDHNVRGPFFLYELVEDRFVRMRNHDQIGRTEFIQLGLDAQLQLTQSLKGWGSTQSAMLYSLTASDGFTLPWEHNLLATAIAERYIASTGEPLAHEGVNLRYYAPQGPRSAIFTSLTYDHIGTAAAPDQLQIGGDTGLRGYPLRYQEGEDRALLTIEGRYYTDFYPWRLFRVGAAAFYDRGRAWGGVNQNTVNGGWLSDVGVGLRLSLDRTFPRVLHLDVAVPLDRVEGIKRVQYLVRTEVAF
jgi:hypothetical protein